MSSVTSVSSHLTRLNQLALLTKHRNTMGNLPAPIRSKLFNRYGNHHYQACVCSMQGYRANMEDSHLVHLSFTSHPLYSLFAIFDGHNGRKAAQYLSKHLISKLDALPTLEDNKQIQDIILSMDEEFCQSQHGQSGSTVVFAIVRPIDNIPSDINNNNNNNINNTLHKQDSNDSIHSIHSNKTVSIDDDNISDDQQYEIRVFWAGDSRAILLYKQETNKNNNTNSNSNTFKELTTDHRPNNPSEKIRIETANGLIINNRVDSKLAVSRAFGDCNLKNNKLLSWEKQRVTSLTECITTYACKNDKLFLFCDGLVEYLENNQLIKLLFEHLNKYEDPVYGLGYLFDEILEGGSRDNMTAIIISFTNASEYGNNGRHKTFLPGPLSHFLLNKVLLNGFNLSLHQFNKYINAYDLYLWQISHEINDKYIVHTFINNKYILLAFDGGACDNKYGLISFDCYEYYNQEQKYNCNDNSANDEEIAYTIDGISGIKLGEYNCGYKLDKERLKSEIKNKLFGDSEWDMALECFTGLTAD